VDKETKKVKKLLKKEESMTTSLYTKKRDHGCCRPFQGEFPGTELNDLLSGRKNKKGT